MKSNLQIGIEAMRADYQKPGRPPLLSMVAWAHQLSVRDFASIFGIAKSTAQEVISHKKLPSLELALKIARYFEVTVEDLFGWRVDDGGERRPLVVVDPKTGQRRRLGRGRRTGAIELAVEGGEEDGTESE